MADIVAADLFCGAGGGSAGIYQAAAQLGRGVKLAAINHWDIAIETHKANHPEADHFLEDLDYLDPKRVIGGKRINLLLAAPQCTHFSNSRGGVPKNDQLRSSAWIILRWAEAFYVQNIIIENVPEFKEWGPLGANGQPLKSKRGQTFLAFIEALRSLGYNVEYRDLVCANYGDPTTRKRLFIMARRNRRVVWPEPTHSENGDKTMFADYKRWIPAKDVIDWGDLGSSIFTRKRPLKPKTLARIESGLKKYGGAPFLALFYGQGKTRSIDRPLPTATTSGAHVGLCYPSGVDASFLVKYYGSGGAVPLDRPLDTITTKDRFGLINLVKNKDGGDILFRMLKAEEYALGMSFPLDYIFKGNKTQIKKQIGNAIPVQTAAALCRAILQ